MIIRDMKITLSQLRKIIREEVQRSQIRESRHLKDDGVVNDDTGEWLGLPGGLPPEYQGLATIDDLGYTALPDQAFQQLFNELRPQKKTGPTLSYEEAVSKFVEEYADDSVSDLDPEDTAYDIATNFFHVYPQWKTWGVTKKDILTNVAERVKEAMLY